MARAFTVRETRLKNDLEAARGEIERLKDEVAEANKVAKSERDQRDACRVRLQRTREIRDELYSTMAFMNTDKRRLEETIKEARQERRRVQDQLRRLKAPRKLSQARERLRAVAVGFGESRMLPEPMVATAVEIISDPLMGEVLEALTERESSFATPQEMVLAGIGMSPQARRHFNQALDAHWAKPNVFVPAGEKLIVGSGVHAAIFASVYYRRTGRKPIVVEKNKRAGGSFAMTEGPAFYLNSRNRPGQLSIPGDEFGALNVLPGAPIQPSQISGSEYIANDVLAFVVRVSLLMNANVFTDIELTGVSAANGISYRSGSRSRSNSVYGASSIFVATGIGEPRKAFTSVESERYLSYVEFMKRMDSPYPLRDMKRVAVIGAGDGGKTVIEALTGQGPESSLSVASMDYPQIIDWFGVPEDRRTRQTWEACNRSRYKGIGRLLPRENASQQFRVEPFAAPNYLDIGYDSLRLNAMPYDYVIDASGYVDSPEIGGVSTIDMDIARDGSNGLGRKYRDTYVIGPAAKLPLDRMEPQVLNGIKENETSIFRYADKTARLAEII